MSTVIGTLNKCIFENENSQAVEQRRPLYLFMMEHGYGYSLYRIGEPTGDTSGVRGLGVPLLTMDKAIYPEYSAVTSMGSRIYIIGGLFGADADTSNKVFVYDSSSRTVVPGANMNSGKLYPYLFTFGSKIFALSRRMYASETRGTIMESNPRFEMLDTSDEDPKWAPLPNPVIHGSFYQNMYTPCAGAGVLVNGCTPVIFISVKDVGTYVFEVDNLVWYNIGTELLPVSEVLVTIPYAPSLCFGRSLKSKRLAAFHFHYEGNGKGFKVNEVRVDGYENLPSLGGPPLLLERSLPVVFGPDKRVYLIRTGIDEAGTSLSPPGNRYVNVYALNLHLNVPRSFKKRKLIGHGEDQDETTKCTNMNQLMDLDEEQDETVEVALNKGQSSKSWKGYNEEQNETTECGNERMEMEVEEETKAYLTLVELPSMWGEEEQNETTEVNFSKVESLTKSGNEKREMKVEEETEEPLKLGLSSVWGQCLSDGPAVVETLHVLGAIAM